jgi:Electron transfer DM13
MSSAVADSATGGRAWRATAGLLALAVAASVCAAIVGWAIRSSAGTPAGESPGLLPTTEQLVPSSVLEAPPLGPTSVLLTARFQSLDVSTEGEAALLDVGGNPMVRLRDFHTDADRGLVLYLVPVADARTPADGVALGQLKAANGEEYYPVPVGARLDGALTVLIWSRGFKGPVAHASLRR